MKYLVLASPSPMQLTDSKVVDDGFDDAESALRRATEWLDEHGSKTADGYEFAYVLPYAGGVRIDEDNLIEEF